MLKNEKKRKVSFEEYQKAMEEIIESNKSFKSVNRHLLLLFAFCSIAILLYVFSQEFTIPSIGSWFHSIASKVFIPYIVFVVVFYLILLGYKVIKSLRCPKCRRFFHKGELELYISTPGVGVGINSSGDQYFRPTNTRAYWTECKYCSHIIWVTKGG